MDATPDYYLLLEIDRSASQADIKKAYRVMALRYHPDLNAADGAEDRFKSISRAYSVLSNPAQRQQYDLYGAVPRLPRPQHTEQPGGQFRGCRKAGRGAGRGCGGMWVWQDILRKR